MENIEYLEKEQESPFEVINTDNDSSVNFAAYEDQREKGYTTISEHEEGEYYDSTVTDNNYDYLEEEYGLGKENNEYHYVKMKKEYINKEVGDVLESTQGSPSNTVTISSLEDILSRDDEYEQAA